MMNMPQTELLKNLISDFQKQKKETQIQIQLIDPIATSIRRPAANRLLNKSMLIVGEILMYALFVLFLGFTFLANHIPFFDTWDKVTHLTEVKDSVIENDLLWFEIIYKGSFLLLSLLFLWIGRMLSNFRKKNDVLQLAAKNMNTIVEKLLNRKVEIEQLEHEYDGILSVDAEGEIGTTLSAHKDIPFDELDNSSDLSAIEPDLKDNKNTDQPLDPNHRDIIL